MAAILKLLSGERLDEAMRNTERLIEGTDKLILEMRELIKALNSHRRTMNELLKAIEESR
ncbi:unnamed protein product [marine sediment metagenome]|uniref:Uncharacterized protein n=1 Tax=marine sediment metagenome TaxID=412755 RepID=X1U9U1_9ZZZZ